MKEKFHIPVITVDGPSGTGKGTLAQHLAEYLHWHYLDSGAIYRAVAWAVRAYQQPKSPIQPLIEFISKLAIKFQPVDHQVKVFCNHQDITDEIREEWCGEIASQLAAIPEVRSALLRLQRQFRAAPGLVTDGRDMGTQVFQDADLKLFLTASAEVRAQRRYGQLRRKGKSVSLAGIQTDLVRRDQRDASRLTAPLRPAQDALIVDTTSQDALSVFQRVLPLVEQALKKA